MQALITQSEAVSSNQQQLLGLQQQVHNLNHQLCAAKEDSHPWLLLHQLVANEETLTALTDDQVQLPLLLAVTARQCSTSLYHCCSCWLWVKLLVVRLVVQVQTLTQINLNGLQIPAANLGGIYMLLPSHVLLLLLLSVSFGVPL